MWIVPSRFKVKTIKTKESDNHTVHTNYMTDEDRFSEYFCKYTLTTCYMLKKMCFFLT